MRTHVYLLAAVLLLSALAYLPSLRGDFVWDDRALILEDEQVHSLANAPKLFLRDFFAPGADDFEYGYYRPLVSLSYMVDWALWRDDPLGYRLANLFWHLLATTLLYLFVLRLLPAARWAALPVMALFGLHPIHTESVAWIAGRTDVICTVFALLALLLWQIYLQRNQSRLTGEPTKKNPLPARRSFYLATVAAVMLLLSLLAKEMGLAAFAFAILLAWPAVGANVARLKRLLPEAALFLLAVIVYFALRAAAGVHFGEPSAEHTLWKAIATFPSAFAGYMSKLVLVPVKMTGYIVWPYLNQPFTAWGIAGLLLLAGLIFIAVRQRNGAPLLAVAAAALLLCFGPLANLVRISGPSDMGFVMAERFLYLPSAFLMVLFAALLAQVSQTRPKLPRKTIVALIAVMAVAFGVRTAFAAKVWTGDESVYRQALSVNEEAPLMWTNLGGNLRRQGRLDEALTALRKAEEINNRRQSADWVAIYNNLGTTLASMGKLDEALTYFDQAAALGKQTDRVQFNRGEALRLLERLDEALAAYDASLASNPAYIDPRLRRAQIKMAMNDPAAAETDLREVLRLDPAQADALANLGMIMRRRGKFDDASRFLRQSLRLRPENLNAIMALGGIAGQQGNFREAVAQFELAARLAPDEIQPQTALVAALFRLGEKERAKALLDSLAQKYPDNPDVLVHQMHWYYEQGDLATTRELLARAQAIAPDHPEVRRYAQVLGAQP